MRQVVFEKVRNNLLIELTWNVNESSDFESLNKQCEIGKHEAADGHFYLDIEMTEEFTT